MNWIIIYIVSLVVIIAILTSGYILQTKAQQVFKNAENIGSEKEITGEQLAHILINNEKIDASIAKINTDKTNYYSFKYNVIKLATNTMFSYELSQLAICAFCTKQATLAHKNNFLFVIDVALNFISKVFAVIFIPIVLICSILNISLGLTTVSFLILLILLISLTLGAFYQILKLTIGLISTNKYIKKIEETNYFTKKELETIKNQIKAIYKLYYFEYTKFTTYFFKLLSPDFLFNHKKKTED